VTPVRRPLEAAGLCIGWLSRASAVLAMVVLLGITVYVLVEIGLRAARGSGTNVLVEFVGYGLAAITFLAASATMREGGLVRVGILLDRVSPGVRRVLDVMCLLSTIAVIALLTWYVASNLWRAWDRGYETDSLVPLPSWLPPLPMLLGMLTFLLDMSLHLVLVARGDIRIANDSPDVI
jgi:TRAP-type C4-dicarboxylate transport system permease small subunit